jgi:hypothetical protein
MGGEFSTQGQIGNGKEFWLKKLKERDSSEDVGVDGRTIIE